MITKFRAWIKEAKEVRPVYAIVFVSKKVWVEEPNDNNTVGSLGFDDVILMQSTGLKDKNGREIFEGDLITSTGVFNSVVRQGKWEYEEDFGAKSKSIGFYIDSSYEDNPWCEPFRYTDIHSNYEVVGNIYENPDKVGYGDE